MCKQNSELGMQASIMDWDDEEGEWYLVAIFCSIFSRASSSGFSPFLETFCTYELFCKRNSNTKTHFKMSAHFVDRGAMLYKIKGLGHTV